MGQRRPGLRQDCGAAGLGHNWGGICRLFRNNGGVKLAPSAQYFRIRRTERENQKHRPVGVNRNAAEIRPRLPPSCPFRTLFEQFSLCTGDAFPYLWSKPNWGVTSAGHGGGHRKRTSRRIRRLCGPAYAGKPPGTLRAFVCARLPRRLSTMSRMKERRACRPLPQRRGWDFGLAKVKGLEHG